MARIHPLALLAVAVTTAGVFSGLGACKKAATGSTCASNVDCRAPGTRCDTTVHQCICATDEACPMGQFCNHAGVCQGIAGCTNNSDCTKPNTYCDAMSGTCLEGPALQVGSMCGLATHCPYGTVCMSGTCQDGCFGDGDCTLGQVCLQGVCTTAQGICSSDMFCKYGETCSNATSPSTCRRDLRGPYCRGCTGRTQANPEPCDDPRNFCLINSLERGGHPEYCGVDCSLGQECANGYHCDGVVILTQQICTLQAQCKCDRASITFATATCTISASCDPHLSNGQPDPNADFCLLTGHPQCNSGTTTGTAACVVARGQTNGFCECAHNSDCPSGGTCVDGACCMGGVPHPERICSTGEADVSGFCTCATDSDCPRDVCDGSRSACVITGQPCTPGSNDCGPIPCVMGGCVIGKNCAPNEGLTCTILTTGG
jgi:hypothetical protein